MGNIVEEVIVVKFNSEGDQARGTDNEWAKSGRKARIGGVTGTIE
jgi:hypothetical protein